MKKNQHFDREIRELRDSGQAADKNARDVAALGELGWGQKLWRASNYWGAALFFLLGGIVGYFCARQILRPSQPEPTQPVETPEQVNFEKELAQDEFRASGEAAIVNESQVICVECHWFSNAV